MGSKRVPEVRFRGFSGEWKKYQLGDLSKIRRGASPRPIQDPKWFDDKSDVGWLRISDVTEQNGLIHFVEQHISKEGQRKTLVLNEPHLILSIAATVGKPVINYIKTGIHDGFIVFLEPSFSIEFMFQWLEMFRPQWQKYGQPGSQVNINSELVRVQQISLPSLDEQEVISDFFKQLDEIIAFQQQELDTLKQTKKGFLQKMFPKEGESIPEIRFPRFSGEWEERNFFDNINSVIDFRGRTPKKLGLDWSKSGYLALSALNVKNGYIDLNVDAYYGDEELYNKWMGDKKLKQGQVLFTTEAPMGNVAQVPDDKGYILSQRTIAFDVDDAKITNDFLSILLRSPIVINELYSMSSGGTAKGVSQKSLSKLKIVVPKSLEEQIQIGNFFKQLHRTIVLYEQELDILKQTKKAFLQKMFV
ncbi:restriction endonuclease subunit S [Bacillus safensis]|uniref:restriction endonuclease subunit S n=1 Tax=Bacillus safensis TaxID=561879 RepID=UPI000DAD4411|nr:restriction endonuclease subunit S [Bacillus safensis]